MGSVPFVPGQWVGPATAGLASAGLASASLPPLAPAAETAAANPRLVTAAHQFEAAMMQEILGPLTREMQGMGGLSSDAEDGVTDDGDGGPNQALTSFASEALGEALSERGGFGIASSVLKKLSHVAHKSASTSGNPASSTKPFRAHLSATQHSAQSGKMAKAGKQFGN